MTKAPFTQTFHSIIVTSVKENSNKGRIHELWGKMGIHKQLGNISRPIYCTILRIDLSLLFTFPHKILNVQFAINFNS